MWEYKNRNYIVRILDDGTKFRLSDNPVPEIPESIDVKITNKCDGGCAFCHEKSTPDGKSFNVNLAYRLFKELPGGVELAIGGGNPLECLQDLRWLDRKLQYNGLIKNITINAKHLDMFNNCYLGLEAIGVSYNKNLHKEIKEFSDKEKEYHQIVVHLIAGVHTTEDLKRCLEDFDRVLILGYKQFGRGIEYYGKDVEDSLTDWKQNIGQYLRGKDKIVVFDNLAITQLDVKRYFSDIRWKDIYMGNDGQFTMYLDLVEEKFAVSSRSPGRFDIGDMSIKEMFAKVRSKK